MMDGSGAGPCSQDSAAPGSLAELFSSPGGRAEPGCVPAPTLAAGGTVVSFPNTAPSARCSQPPCTPGVGPKAIPVASARTPYVHRVNSPDSRCGLLCSRCHIAVSYQPWRLQEQPLPLQLRVSLPGGVSSFSSSKVMPCPTPAESLLPGKGFGTMRSYFITIYYSCKKKYWLLVLYLKINSWSGR